jgi:hypothetical protein
MARARVRACKLCSHAHVQKRMIKTLPSSETLTTVSPSAPDWKKSNVHLLHFIQGACKVTHTLRLPKMMISNNHQTGIRNTLSNHRNGHRSCRKMQRRMACIIQTFCLLQDNFLRHSRAARNHDHDELHYYYIPCSRPLFCSAFEHYRSIACHINFTLLFCQHEGLQACRQAGCKNLKLLGFSKTRARQRYRDAATTRESQVTHLVYIREIGDDIAMCAVD